MKNLNDYREETALEFAERFKREADAMRRWTIWFAVYSFVLLCIGWLARGWLA